MIERYLYSIPKKKRIFYGLLVAWTFISLLSFKVQCGPFQWLVGKVTDNITDEIFTAMNQSLGEAFGALIDWFLNKILEPFGPDLTTFTDNTNFGSISLADFLDRFSIFTGMFLATLIFGFSMIIYFFSGKISDSKDTPVSLFGRYALAIAICYKHKKIYTTILDIIDKLYTSMASKAIAEELKKEGLLGIIAKVADDKITIFGVEQVLSFTFPGVGLIVLIIQIVLIWKLLKGFLKLYCEMVSRYIVTIVLLLLFAAFGGTIVSNNTSSIFKSYLRTLFSSFIVMVFNMTWFKGCFIAVLGGNSFTLIQYVFVLELLAFGLKFDGMLRSMGLGVATGGSRIGNAIAGAGRNIAGAMRAANAARKSGGGILKAGGVMTNNPTMYKLGSMLGASASEALNNGGLGGIGQMAADYGAMGKKIPDNLLQPGDAAGILDRAMKNPGDQKAQDALSALSGKSVLAGAKELGAKKGIDVSNARAVNFMGADGKEHTGILFSGKQTKYDKDGNAHTRKVDGTMGSARAFEKCQRFGDGLGINYSSQAKTGTDNSTKSGAWKGAYGGTGNGQNNGSTAGSGSGKGTASASGSGKTASSSGKANGPTSTGSGKGPDGPTPTGTAKGGSETTSAGSAGSASAAGSAGSANGPTEAGGAGGTAGSEPHAVGTDPYEAAQAMGGRGVASPETAQSELREALGGDDAPEDMSLGEASATGFTGLAESAEGYDAPLEASIDRNEDGSGIGTMTNLATNESSSFDVPAGMSDEEALSSDAATNAAKAIGGGDSASISDFEPSSYSAPVYDSDSTDTLSASVVTGEDGSSSAVISGENGSIEVPMSEGQTLSDALGSDEGRSAISELSGDKSPIGYEANAFSTSFDDGEGNAVDFSARFDTAEDGSRQCTFSLNDNEGASVSVPSGMSNEEFLDSDAGQSAISSMVGDGATFSSSDFEPTECSFTMASDPVATVGVSLSDGEDGSQIATVSRDGETVGSYSIPEGQSFEESLGSSEAQDVFGSAVGDGYTVSGLYPEGYSGSASSHEAPITAEFGTSEDGSTMGVITNTVTGETSTISVPEGQSYSEALSSEEGQSAISRVSGGDASVSNMVATDYDIPVSRDGGPSENYSVHFDNRGDGSYSSSVRDSSGSVIRGEDNRRYDADGNRYGASRAYDPGMNEDTQVNDERRSAFDNQPGNQKALIRKKKKGDKK